MRTTITLEAELLAKLKRRASESGTSVSRLIEQASRLLMQAPPATRRSVSFEIVTFGAGGRFSKHNLDKTSAIFEAEEVERFKRMH
jgi:hypothetical protein